MHSNENQNDTRIAQTARWLSAYRESEVHAREQAFADSGECPPRADVLALSEGRIDDPTRRAKLARHLLACPRCGDDNLRQLSDNARTAELPSLVRLASHRKRIGWSTLAAVALLLVLALVAWREVGPAGSPAVNDVRLVDQFGLEMRSVNLHAQLHPRRVLVRTGASGWLALGRVRGSDLELEPLEGSALLVETRAGEELVLPLDRPLDPIPAPAVAPGEDWLVLHFASPPLPEELPALLRQAARGMLPAGVSAWRITGVGGRKSLLNPR